MRDRAYRRMNAERKKRLAMRRILARRPGQENDLAYIGLVARASCALLCQCAKCGHARHTRKPAEAAGVMDDYYF